MHPSLPVQFQSHISQTVIKYSPNRPHKLLMSTLVARFPKFNIPTTLVFFIFSLAFCSQSCRHYIPAQQVVHLQRSTASYSMSKFHHRNIASAKFLAAEGSLTDNGHISIHHDSCHSRNIMLISHSPHPPHTYCHKSSQGKSSQHMPREHTSQVHSLHFARP